VTCKVLQSCIRRLEAEGHLRLGRGPSRLTGPGQAPMLRKAALRGRADTLSLDKWKMIG